MNSIQWLRDRFNLDDEKSEAAEVISSIERGIYFRGTNLWVLIFAILIASIGLNVNSTAVIIGAMLISPLMGPIMGVGLGLGINDLTMIRKAGYNLLIAVIIGLGVSFLYFSVSPLNTAHSELLARTTPTTWDVFIALIGGLAGIIGATSKNKGNVIPGVAIATALMPPLCTAGYGIAVGNWYYFLGAIYLFLINSVFICLATYLIVRFLKFPAFVYPNPDTSRKVKRWIILATSITFIPSIYLAWLIVFNSSFAEKAEKFIEQEIRREGGFVVQKKIDPSAHLIELNLIGKEYEAQAIEKLKGRLQDYGLRNVQLRINAEPVKSPDFDPGEIKNQIINDFYKNTLTIVSEKDKQIIALENQLKNSNQPIDSLILNEFRVLFPSLEDLSVSVGYFTARASNPAEKYLLVYARQTRLLSVDDTKRMEKWLKTRLKNNRIKLILYHS